MPLAFRTVMLKEVKCFLSDSVLLRQSTTKDQII